VREALRRYSAFAAGLDVEALRFADAGDVASPDGPESPASDDAPLAALIR